MKNLISFKVCLLSAVLAVSALASACNKNPGGGETDISTTGTATSTTSNTTQSFETLQISSNSDSTSTDTSATVPTASETVTTAEIATQTSAVTTSNATETAKQTQISVTSATPKQTVSAATTKPIVTTVPPVASTTPKQTVQTTTTPKPTETTTTKPAEPFDPQPYIDYAIEYGESIGLVYKPKLNDTTKYGGKDEPIENCSWENPFSLGARTDPTLKRRIRERLDGFLVREIKYFRPEVYTLEYVFSVRPQFSQSIEEGADVFFIFH